MARDIKLQFYCNSNVNAANTHFDYVIDNDVDLFNITFDKLKEYARSKGVDNTVLNKAFNNKAFYKISPVGFNAPIDDEDPDIMDDKFTTIDYGGLRCFNPNASSDTLCSAGVRVDADGAKVVRNLNISTALDGITKLTGGGVQLREFYGDIDFDGKDKSDSIISLFERSVNIQKAGGLLRVRNTKAFQLVYKEGGSTAGTWFNVLDLRHVDTSSCTNIILLNHYTTPCTIILGNFSMQNVTSITDIMSDAPKRGRRVVLTTETPPVLKNCTFSSGLAQDKYSNKLDWVAKGNIEVIYVPFKYYKNYNENVYAPGGTLGNTGWSYYGSYGKNIIKTYNPDTQFLEKKEGGENGRTIWLYRAPNR